MFEHAILLDPGFALAHAGIANVCGLVFEWHEAAPAWLERGRAASERALALDPGLPEALVGRARCCTRRSATTRPSATCAGRSR